MKKYIKNNDEGSVSGDFLFKAIITFIFIIIIIIIIYFNSASFKRHFVDLKSDIGNGLERTVTVYTADGNVIAKYSGKIDLEDTDGYVKFDLNGKRYIYYNCFVETIADIN